VKALLPVRIVIIAAGIAALGFPMLLAQSAGGVQQPAPPGAAGAAAPTEGTAAVSGVITDATTKQPLPGVMVYLGSQGRGAVGRLSRQMTDAKGRFVFTDLPAGTLYFINTSKFGYIEGHYGTGAGGQLGGLIAVTEGQWFADANVSMQRPSAISGYVTDDRGEPAVATFVRVLVRINVAGHLRLAAGHATKTDDRGMYRIADLMPGRYIVQVPQVQQTFAGSVTALELAGIPADQAAAGRTLPEPPPALSLADGTRFIVGGYLPPPAPADGRAQIYPPMFHPGVTSIAAAVPIDLAAGEEHGSVNITMHAVPASSISGVIDGPAEARAGALLRLLPDGMEELGTGSEVATAMLGADGRFTLVNVPAGSYTIDVRRTLAELQFRTPLTTSTVALPSPPGAAVSSGSGSIGAGPNGATYSIRTAGGNGTYFANQRISVGAVPIRDLVVPLKHASTIRGRFVADPGDPPVTTPPSPAPALIFAEPADGNVGVGMFQAGRTPSAAGQPPPLTFEIQGITGGQFVLRFLSMPTGGSVVSMQADDGVDHHFKPFDTTSGRDYDVVVTTTTKRTDLSGVAFDAKGVPVPNAVVLAFPVEREQWTTYGLSPARLKGSPTSSAGAYRFQSLPAGDYYLVGVPSDQSDVWQDPAKLTQLVSSARRAALRWGDVTKQDVVVVRVQ
jgi:hypothetical protein